MDRNRRLFEPLVRQDFNEYLEKIRDCKEWVGEVEMNALSLKYKIDFEVFRDIGKPSLKIRTPFSTQTVTLACTGGSHYDCVYSKTELSALAFCQAVVYEVLYKRVFGLGSDVDIAVKKMLHDKAYSKQRRNNVLCQLFKESCRVDGLSENHNLPEDDQASLKNPRLEIRRALAQGIPPFPYKVAKTLDPGIYRNVEFDMWNEKRKEDQKNEQFVIPKLEPGVKCKVHINKEVYIGHVQDIYDDSDDVSVYIEELCKRCVVSSTVLEIVPVPAYKALTWQGGKTYKVHSDNLQTGFDVDRSKYKKGFRKNQDSSQTHNSGSSNLKPSHLLRSNSLSTSNNSFRDNSLHSSNSFVQKKGHMSSTPIPNKKGNASQKESHKGNAVHSPNFSCVWNGLEKNMPTSPIPIPGKVNCSHYKLQLGSPEVPLNDTADSGWNDVSVKNSTYSCAPTAYAIYSDESGYSSLPAGSYLGCGATPDAAMTVPLPAPPLVEDMPQSPVQPTQCPAVTVYPCPLYAVPGMYFVCREGSSLPVNIGAWEGGSEVAAGVPSVYFNTPPTGMSPPITQWIPGYGSSWPPPIPSSVAFTPPLEMNAYQPLVQPQWSPQTAGIYVSTPPPPPVAYQVLPPEPAQN